MFFIHFHCFLPSQDKKHANVRNIYMHFLRTLRHLFDAKRDLTPFFERQAELLCQSSDILVRMFTAVDPEQWILRQREIKPWRPRATRSCRITGSSCPSA